MRRRLGLSRIFLPAKGREKEPKIAELKVIDLRRFDGKEWSPYGGDLPKTPLLKDLGDRTAAFVAILFLLPLYAVTALAIRLTSRGPIVYRQVRIGQNRRTSRRPGGRPSAYYDVYDRRSLDLPGRPFIIYKFRTMVDRAEEASGPMWARENDPRITVFGRLLRRLRIDETPQFFNVLKGDMSLVGPRPERPTFVRDLIEEIPEYAIRLRVKPGITGLAQVEHRYDTCLEDVRTKLRYDLAYIRNLSLWNDFKICCRTVSVVITARGQ
ncbi:MAG: sugar transferase [Candidatus Eisenbacteria bacterium]